MAEQVRRAPTHHWVLARIPLGSLSAADSPNVLPVMSHTCERNGKIEKIDSACTDGEFREATRWLERNKAKPPFPNLL